MVDVAKLQSVHPLHRVPIYPPALYPCQPSRRSISGDLLRHAIPIAEDRPIPTSNKGRPLATLTLPLRDMHSRLPSRSRPSVCARVSPRRNYGLRLYLRAQRTLWVDTIQRILLDGMVVAVMGAMIHLPAVVGSSTTAKFASLQLRHLFLCFRSSPLSFTSSNWVC